MEPNLWHVELPTLVTWGLILLSFAVNYGKSVARFEANVDRITKLESRMTISEKNHQELVEVKRDVKWIVRLLQRIWGGEDSEKEG